VRSTAKQKITSRGLRWVSAMLLVQVPFASAHFSHAYVGGTLHTPPLRHQIDVVNGIQAAEF
jgi:hypothetical protein